METAIINMPTHHRDTNEIAEFVANSLEAELYDLKDFNPDMMDEYDIIGLGTQLYWFKPHKKLRMFIEDLNKVQNGKVFILSTSSYRKNLSGA